MNNDWKNQKVLVAGLGSIGQRHARILSTLGITDITVCDMKKELVDKTLNEYPGIKAIDSYEDGLKQKPDAVYILTPPKLHIPMALKAIESGCNIFCEKPVSDNMYDVAKLSEVLAVSDVKFMVGLCFRFHEGVLRAKKILESGKIGRLVSIRALMGEHLPAVRPDYKTLFSSQYSGAFDLMHDLDLAVWFANQPVKNVFSVYGSFSDIGIKAPDMVEFLVEFQDRCAATVHLDFFQQPRRRQIELIGTEGVVILEFASWDEYTLSVYEVSEGAWVSDTKMTTRDDMFIAENISFLKTIAELKELECDIFEGIKSLQLVERAKEQFK